MTTLRVGTRGSDLALWQTRWVCAELRKLHPDLQIQEMIIKTQGDKTADQPFGSGWPVGAFVHAIEQALLINLIDFAVHSYKDLQTACTQELTIAAVPKRAAVHDVLLTREPVDLDHLPGGFRVGTSSPRRVAQISQLGDVVIVPTRGNVPTRLSKLNEEDLDGIVLAAAGLERLGIDHEPRLDLPTDRFVPAPAQGALAIQTRESDGVAEIIHPLDDAPSRLAVEAERAYFRGLNAGCHTPAGALATIDGSTITLKAQLFSDDGTHIVEATEIGEDPHVIGIAIAERLLDELKDAEAGKMPPS